MKERNIFQVSDFDWDEGNWPKCGKHGVSRSEIERMFFSDPWIFFDDRHSDTETRFLAIGPNGKGKYVFVAFTFRANKGKLFIRPISARYMHDEEVQHYEHQQEKTERNPASEVGSGG